MKSLTRAAARLLLAASACLAAASAHAAVGTTLPVDFPAPLDVSLGFDAPRPIDALQLCHPNMKATHTGEKPNRVSPVPLKDVTAAADRVQATLAPASWNMIRLARQR